MQKKTKISKKQLNANSGYTVLAAVPYQLCPKCGGTGLMSMAEPGCTGLYSNICDICHGGKIIPMHIVPAGVKIDVQKYIGNICVDSGCTS